MLLQSPSARDRTEFLALVHASRGLHRGRASPAKTPSEFAKFVARSRRPAYATGIVRRRHDGSLVGVVELSQIVHGNFRSSYLGYWIGAPFAGRGFMTEAVALMVRHAFVTLRLHRVEANVQPDNAASIAILRRLGFEREGFSRRYLRIAGRWRDHERWALLVEDWRAAR